MPKRIEFEDKICENCEKLFNRGKSPSGRLEAVEDFRKRRFCCKDCYNKWHVGENHHNYKDGLRRGHDWGYLRVTSGKYLHRVVMEEHLGRELDPDEHIHHKNGDVTDNRVENLEILANSEHRKEHCKTQKRNAKGSFCV